MKRIYPKNNTFYVLGLSLLVIVGTSTSTGCDPHRSGAVVKQGGAPRSMKRHHKPASAKRQKKNKY